MEAGPTAGEVAYHNTQVAQGQIGYLWDELRKYKRRLKKLEQRIAKLEQNGEDK